MSVLFPASKDTLTNPTSGDLLSAVPHATQHADANDLLEALQDAAGYGTTPGEPYYGFLFKNNTAGKIAWKNAANSSSASILQNASDVLVIDNPDATVTVTGATGATITATTNDLSLVASSGNVDVSATYLKISSGSLGIGTDASAKLHVNSGTTNNAAIFESTDAEANIGFKDSATGATIPTIGSDGDNVFVEPATNGDVFVIRRMPRKDLGSTAYQDSHIQRGWTYITGDASREVSTTVTLPVAYNSADSYEIMVTPLGEKTSGGAPSVPSDLSVGGYIACTATPISSSQFTVEVFKTDASGTLASGQYYAFGWVTVGREPV